jgi:methionine-rich copper-binding protein CopC
MQSRPVIIALSAVAVLVLATASTFAHARLKSASPAANATSKVGLAEIRLQFNEAVEPALSVLELLDKDGKTIASSKGKLVCENMTCVFAIEPLQPGSYGVRYHVLSEDGHTIEASYGFNVVK